MKIGIDCRIWGVKHGGIGRYTEELVRSLQKLDRVNKYLIFCRAHDIDSIPTAPNFKTILADIKHYTLAEQLKLPKIFEKENLDLLHVPHFNVPVIYRGKFIVTIHDLIWHDVKGLHVTTLPAPAYIFKYVAYRTVVRNSLFRASKIIVPSDTIKNDLTAKYPMIANKIRRTYEGATVKILKKYPKKSILEKYNLNDHFLLYIGALYPHKNLETVVRAIKTLDKPPQLVIICSRNVFLNRFNSFLEEIQARELVNLVGFIPDNKLGAFYNSAIAYVFPSLSEGFGLPGLEAMAYGTPVLASNISVLREVYGNAAIFFDPTSVRNIAEKVKEIVSNISTREKLIKLGRAKVKEYSWDKMANETLKIYKECKKQ